MDPVTIGLWIDLIATAIQLGTDVVAHVKAAMKASSLTNEQIDQIEQAGIDESERRRTRRQTMIGG